MYKYFFSSVVFFVFLSQGVSAYIDPGTGSFVFQMIVGGVLGFFFVIKLYFRRIKSFVLKIFRKNKNGVTK